MNLQQWLAWIELQHPKHIAMGLERVHAVAQRMQLAKPGKRVVTVGGTNGKGSTVAFIEGIARAANLRVGAYTSPHLLRYNERVRMDGVDAGDDEIVRGFEAVDAARGDIPLTYFEYGTLAALWLFQQANLDLAILEVGLGGRLDAVNIVDADVAVITTVDLDHQEWLGDDRESIGAEKAGIARAWKPLILGERDSPSSVLRHAYAIGARALRLGSDFIAEPVDALHWRWRDAGSEMILPNPVLAAPAQIGNAATAVAVMRALGLELPQRAFAQGVATARAPGRLQRFVQDDVEVFVDVGHNPQAARQLAAWLRAQAYGGEAFLVYAALADKDARAVVAAFEGIENPHWLLAGSLDAGARGQAVAALAAKLEGTPAGAGTCFVDVPAALNVALAGARASSRAAPGRVLVFGSFHAAESAIRQLQR